MTLNQQDLDEISKPQRLKCSVQLLANRLSKEDVAALRRAIASPKEQYPHTAIRKWLNTAGYDIGVDAIRRHRNGDCNCDQ